MKNDAGSWNVFSKLFRAKSASNFNVLSPDDIEVTFDSIIGLDTAKDELRDVVEYIKNSSKFDALDLKPHMHYLIQGPDGSGKSSLAYAVAKEADIPIIVTDFKYFADAKSASFNLLNNIFKSATAYPYSVVLLRNFEGSAHINQSFQLMFFRKLIDLMCKHENVVVITTLSTHIQLNGAGFLFDEDGFAKTIDVDYPELKYREEMYKLFCANLPIAKDVSFNRLAIDSFNMTAKDIKHIIKNATLLSVRRNCEFVSHEHFDEIISSQLLGQKKKKMTEKERVSTAYHEAGHVIAGYFSAPDYKLSKVEIVHRSDSLGVTMQESDEDKFSMFKEEYEQRIIGNFGGMVAERLIYGSNSSGVSQDLATATLYAKLMVSAFGMSDSFGPMSIYTFSCDDDDSDTICGFSEKIIGEADLEARKILEELYTTTVAIVSDHRVELEALTKALLEREVIFGSELKEIFENATA